MTSYLKSIRVLLAFCLVVASYTGAWAQAAGSGTIRGSVVDPQQRVIAGAQVIVRSNDFNTTRSLLSDPAGDFVTPLLPAGTYTIQVEAPGFAPRTLSKVNLSVGSTIHLSVKLQLPHASEQVTVTGRAPTVEGNTVAPEVNKQEVEAGNFFAGLTVTYLPNRDRDFTQFAQLSAGSVETETGQGSGLSIAGQRSTALNVEVDGMSFRDPLRGGARGSDDNSLFFPQTVVREFEVVRSGATAEVGNTNAGLVNVLTKSGSNKFHGEGFYIGRPAALSSRDTFDHSLDNTQNEFGGSFGGPIRRDRAFYYFGAEQDFVNVPYWTQFQPQAPGTVSPANLLAQQQQNVAKSDPTALFGRLDFILTPRNSVNLQLNYNRIHNTGFSPDNSTRTDAAFDNSLDLLGHSIWARGGLVTTFGAGTVNQLLAQWAVDQRDFRPRSLSPEVVINGFGRLGGNSTYPDQANSQRSQVSDDLALYRRGLLVQFGGVFAYDPLTEQREANLNGRFDFNSLADYLNDTPRRYQQTFVTGDPQFQGAIRELGFYVNLKAPLRPSLTLSAGLRWQGQWNPQPGLGNPAIPQTERIPNDLAQWQPRLGLAWNPARNTVVRLAAGLYDSPTPGNVFQRVFTDNGRNTTVVDSYFDPQVLPLVAGQLGTGLSAAPVGLTLPQALVVGIAPGFRNPRSFQTSASLEQQVNAKLSVSGGFIHNGTWALQRRLNVNLAPPTIDNSGLPVFPLQRPDPAVGQLLENQSAAHSSYNALLLTAAMQLPHRSQLTANYTLSRSRDDASDFGPFGPDLTLNTYHPSSDQAFSTFDARHTFNLSGVVNLPKGFKANPILIGRSGFPYNPLIGFDLQNDANDLNDRAILNGLVASRNIARQPAFVNLDLRFVKDFTLPGEGHHLDLFLDIFNVTGAGNRSFGPDALDLYGAPGSPYYSAGQALFAPDTNHVGSTRQVQFTARIVAF